MKMEMEMQLKELLGDIKEVNEVIESIEEIAQRLASLQVSMQLLATHCGAISVLTMNEFKSLNIDEKELYKYWNKVTNGENLYSLTEELAINTSKELSYLIYVALEDVKEELQNVNKLAKDIM